jgi:hypothetical protein
MSRTARAVWRAESLRHNALATELASLAKHDLAVLLEMPTSLPPCSQNPGPCANLVHGQRSASCSERRLGYGCVSSASITRPAALSRIWISIGALLFVSLPTRNHHGGFIFDPCCPRPTAVQRSASILRRVRHFASDIRQTTNNKQQAKLTPPDARPEVVVSLPMSSIEPLPAC